MKLLMGNDNGVGRCKEEDCGGGGGGGGGEGGGGRVVVVGVKLDGRSKELLTWALVKVAQSGDRVIALHVLHPKTEEEDQGTLLSLVKAFDSMLAAYEGFCNLKQVDLKLKWCRGTPVRKILAREAKSCGATSLILGPSQVPHRIRSSVSVAKSCARNLPKSISVIAVDNGKILFQRLATTSVLPDLPVFDVAGKGCQRRKILGKSPLSLPPPSVVSEDSSRDGVDNIMALVPVTTQTRHESNSGWALLRRLFMHKGTSFEKILANESSVKQWIQRLPSRRQSFVAIYPDHKHCDDNSPSNLDEEKNAIVAVGSDSITGQDSISSKELPQELEGLLEKYSSTCRVFSYQELLSATSNFSPENLIGKGGSSQVYRGCLPDGMKLAVKILKSAEDVLKQFISEIEIITSLNHKNIISLLGFCFEDNNLLILYDLLARGSLEENLHGIRKNGDSFGWSERYKVAVGTAEALDHLHNASAEPIIHRDVKSSNILLSDDFEPRLSDFGLATLASASCDVDSFDIAGTFGYLAPEYFMHGRLNEKIDVYAFGVVLLELLSGRKPIDNGYPKGQESVVMWAKQILKEGKISQLLDPGLNNSYDHDQFEKMVLAASLCIRRAPRFRPQMSLVVKLLEGDSEIVKWAEKQMNTSEEVEAIDNEEHSPTKIQSFLNLALLNLDDDDSLSSSSTEQMISVEDYLQGRWSRTSSFD